jgi:hypothetical protein
MYRPLVTSEAVLANLVRGAIETRDHPMIDERDEAVADVAPALEKIVRKRLSEKGGWDPRYVSLDGIRTHRVETDGSTRLRIGGRSTYSTSTGTECSPWMPIFRSSRVQSQRSRSRTPRASSICRLANEGSSPRSNRPRGRTHPPRAHVSDCWFEADAKAARPTPRLALVAGSESCGRRACGHPRHGPEPLLGHLA